MILDFNIVYSLLSKFERAGQEETPSTPIRLVREMLDKLPPEIWSDPSKTFLDPACSTGTFLLEIVRKLNIGLASQMPDQTERLKHILTKQVWGLELSRVPFFVTKAALEKLFIDTTGIVGEVNIYRVNALDGAKEIKDMKFDVVVGNPPYNNSDKADKLWVRFIEYSSNILKDGAPLLFVTPIHWKTDERDRYEKVRQVFKTNFKGIEDHDVSKSTFGVSEDISWFIATKDESEGENDTYTSNGKVFELVPHDGHPYNPLWRILHDAVFNEDREIYNCIHDSRTVKQFREKHGTTLSATQDDIYKYKHYMSATKKSTYWSEDPLLGYGEDKILINTGGNYQNKKTGNKTRCGHDLIFVERQCSVGKNIVAYSRSELNFGLDVFHEYITHPLMRFVIQEKPSLHNKAAFKPELYRIPKLPFDENDPNTTLDEFVYEYFGLTEDEITMIGEYYDTIE